MTVAGDPGTLATFSPTALAGKTALVTGGGTGMGAEIAAGYAALGADVAVLSRNPDHLRAAAARIEAAGRRSLVLTCDVRHPEQVAAATEAMVTEFGRIDVLSTRRPATSGARRRTCRRTPGGPSSTST